MSIQSNLPNGPSEESKRIDAQIRALHSKGGIAQAKPTAKPVQVPFRHVIEFDWHRPFTLVERLQILFGCALNVSIRVPTLHKPGELGVLVMGEVTTFDSASELMKDAAQKSLKEQFGEQNIPVIHEPEDKH